MARRYSPLTVVVWVGAFALLGYMGARVSQKQASLNNAGAPAVELADIRNTVAPSERDSNVLAATTPAATAKSVTEPVQASAQTSLAAAAPPLPNASVGASTAVRQAARSLGETAPGTAEMLSTPADTTKSEERPPRLAARDAAAGQSALRADDAPVEKSRAKRAHTHHARHRDVVENGGAPMKSRDRRYAARGDLPARPAPGFRLLPFLPTFLPF